MNALEHRDIIRRANSMNVFADGDATFNFGEWRAWFKACQAAGRILPPKDFKKTHKNPDPPAEERRAD